MNLEQKAKEVSGLHWRVPPEAVSATDLTSSSYPWATKYKFYICGHTKLRQGMLVAKQTLLVSVDASGQAFVFKPMTDPSALSRDHRNRHQLNKIFQDEGLALPPRNVDLPETAQEMLTGRSGWIASPAFWASNKDTIDMWTRDKERIQLFELQCREPVLTRHDDGSWECIFRCFNSGGGVESWILDGNARELRHAQMNVVVPDGTWVVPFG
jgi:hypothetical protein